MVYECHKIEESNGWYILPPLQGTKGSRVKKWVVKEHHNSNGEQIIELFLFKESIDRYPTEFWSEIIASKVAKLINVPGPEVYCAKIDNTYGALIKFFLALEIDTEKNSIVYPETLVEGGDLIVAIQPSFEREGKGETHNIFLVNKVFSMLPQGQDLFNVFLKILVFDTIIGNTDRHQENWGLILDSDGSIVRLAPAFDNTDCFARELVERKIPSFLDPNEESLMNYIYRGKPHLRWSDNGIYLEWLNHFQFIEKLANKWKIVVDYLKEQTFFSNLQLDSIIEELKGIRIENPIYRLSENRCALIKKVICRRRDLLIEQFGINHDTR